MGLYYDFKIRFQQESDGLFVSVQVYFYFNFCPACLDNDLFLIKANNHYPTRDLQRKLGLELMEQGVTIFTIT